MDFRLLATVFVSVFVAELGDKTQLATMLFAADRHAPKLTVFAGTAAALVLTSAIGVLAGGALSHFVGERTLSRIAAAGFVLIGVWTFVRS